MVAPIRSMPPDLVAIISHLELQRTPWWPDAVDSVVLLTLFRSTIARSKQQIREAVYGEYGADLTLQNLNDSLDRLKSSEDIVGQPQESFIISREGSERVGAALAKWEVIRSNARAIFTDLLIAELPDIDSALAWERFQVDLLIPAITDLGAQAWNFIANNYVALSDSIEPYLGRYLSRYPEQVHERLKKVVLSFLDPTVEGSRLFLMDMLSAYFFMTACGLSITEIDKIEKLLANPPDITACLDVDLFLALNDRFDSNTTDLVDSLLELQDRERFVRARVAFTAATITVKEAQAALELTAKLIGPETSDNETIVPEGPLSVTIQGIMAKALGKHRYHQYYQADPGDWESQVNDSPRVSSFRVSPDIYNNIQVVSDASAYRQMAIGSQMPSPPAEADMRYLHDVALRFVISDKRGPRSKALYELNYWIVTSNSFLLRFDAYCAKRTRTPPVCVSPLTLLQMLRLWVPRSEPWERAALGSMRLPFVNLGKSAKLNDAALKVLRALRLNELMFDEADLMFELVNNELKNTLDNASEKLMSATESRGVSEREVKEIKEGLQEVREESTTLRADLERMVREENVALRASLREIVREEYAPLQATLNELQVRSESRRFAARMLVVAGGFSVLLTVLATLFLKENVPLFSSTIVASVTGACIASVLTLLGARLYVSAANGEVAERWRGRLRKWLSWFVGAALVNLAIAVLASGIYGAMTRH